MDIKTLFPNASKDTVALNSGLQGAESQRNAPAPLELVRERKKKSRQRYLLRIKSFRVRSVDTDNLAGGVKCLVDALRAGGCILPDDSPETLVLEVSQEKVKHFLEERTECLIDLL